MKYYINEFSPKDFCMNLYFLMRMNIKEMLIEQRQATVFNGILAAAAISKEYAENTKKRYNIYWKLEDSLFTPHGKLPNTMPHRLKADWTTAMACPLSCTTANVCTIPRTIR